MSQTQPTGWPHGPTQFELRRGNATMRVVTAIIAIPIVATAIWLGGWFFFIFVAAISSGALVEFYWLTEKRGALPNKKLGVAAGLLLSFAFMHGVSDELLLGLFNVAPSDMAVLLARYTLVIGVMLLFAIGTMIDQMFRREGSPLLNNVATVTGVAYISLFLSTLIGLRQLFSSDLPFGRYIAALDPALADRANALGGLTVLAIMITIWTCDSAAYYAGRAMGRHKLFERISPKKTWEGSIAGAIGAVAAMIGMQQWFLPYLSVLDAAVLGSIVGVFGQLGDLAESHIKRDAGVKDSSNLIPGHGGLFDRFDSLLFVAPLVYLYLNIVVLVR